MEEEKSCRRAPVCPPGRWPTRRGCPACQTGDAVLRTLCGCWFRDGVGDSGRGRPSKPVRVRSDDVGVSDEQLVDREMDCFHAPWPDTERAGVGQQPGVVRIEQDGTRQREHLFRGEVSPELLRNIPKVRQRVLLDPGGHDDQIPLVGEVCCFQQAKEEDPAPFSGDLSLYRLHFLEEITHRINTLSSILAAAMIWRAAASVAVPAGS